AVILSILFTVTAFPIASFAEEEAATGKLLNGSFEIGPTFTKDYLQTSSSVISPWQTTAYGSSGTDGLIELLRKNTGTYIKGVTLEPSDGDYAAELNADEESSLYQVVDTEPSSLYEWGLDHGARTESETMALIIGPNQDVSPSKNWGEGFEASDLKQTNPTLRTGYKYGRDQFMQMVDWLKATGRIESTANNNGLANGGKAIILYSKKFGEHGSFLNNEDHQPFSMTPSSVYTEKWYIWLMTDHKAASGVNPWGHYGLNASAEEDGGDLDLDKYYLYTVPAEQNKTLFAFTSVENSVSPTSGYADPTYGNFVDGIKFNLYRSLSGSTTPHGSAIVGGSDGSITGEGAEAGHEVTAGQSVSSYVLDGHDLEIEAIVKGGEADHVTFAGVYYTYQDPETGDSVTQFISAKGDDTGWVKALKENGDIAYQYTLANITCAIHLHFVFIKSPLITYDPNGGKPYACTEGAGGEEESSDANVYSFKAEAKDEGMEYVPPYTSHAPEGQNDGWLFTGWLLFDDTGDKVTLPAEHTIACSYKQGVVTGQPFIAIAGDNSFRVQSKTNSEIIWETDSAALYEGQATGLTLVAQWRWAQDFIPQTDNGTGCIASDLGGSIALARVSEDYSSRKEAGARRYYAGVNETITARATANDGYYFAGWYDAAGNLVTSGSELRYTERAEQVNTYYAKFIKNYTQTFIRQIQDGDAWVELPESDTRAEPLAPCSVTAEYGAYISSTAANNAEYGFIGWYDQDGNQVSDSLICNGGKTIRYQVESDAVYYARFEPSKTISFQVQLIHYDGTASAPSSSDTYYGLLNAYRIHAVKGDTVKAKAYSKQGYQFVGWYDEAGNRITVDAYDANIAVPTVGDADPQVYIAKFQARTDTAYKVNHCFKDANGDSDKTISYTYYGRTGESVTPSVLDISKLSEENQVALSGYVYSNGITTKAITANGSTTFTLNYIRTPEILEYQANVPLEADGSPVGTAVPDELENTSGYAGWPVDVSSAEYSLAGYTFAGWNTKADGSGDPYFAGDQYLLAAAGSHMEGDTEVPDENPNVLYAQWVSDAAEMVPYHVQYIKLDKYGNETIAEEKIYTGAVGAAVTAQIITWEGYSFDAAAANVLSGVVVKPDSEAVPAVDPLMLKVYYIPNPAVLVYKANGGVGDDVLQEGSVDETVQTMPGSIFERAGYTFTGWKTPEGTPYGALKDYVMTAGENILLAQWTANDTRYTVNHCTVSADGTSAECVRSEEKEGKTGTRVTARAIEIPGYVYKSDLNTNGMITLHTGTIAGDGSLVLTLYYVPKIVKLIYDPNGGTGSSIYTSDYYHTETSVLSNTMFSRPGYTFEGWNSQADGTGTDYAPGASYTYGYQDETVYAKWKANEDTPYKVEHYTITPQNECVLYQRDNQTGETGSTVQAEPIRITGYRYKVSYKNDDLHLEEKAEGEIAGNGSLVLRLYYTPLVLYLNYHANNGTDQFQPVSGYISSKITVIDNLFSRPGYTFVQWTENRDGSGAAYQAGTDEYTFTKELDSLYAQWKANTDTSYTVEHYILSPDEKSCSLFQTESKQGTTDTTAAAYPINITGYEYAAGYRNESSGVSEAAAGTVTADGNLVLKLYYQPYPISLVYLPNGGTGTMDPQPGYVGDAVTVSGSLFERPGYTFEKWNTGPDGTGTSYSAGNEYVLTAEGDLLYAIWTPDDDTPYTIEHYRVDENGAAELADLEHLKGTTGTTARASEKAYEGYTFVNQAGDKESVVSGTIAGDGSLVLKLYYVCDMDTLKYLPNGGTGDAYIASGHAYEEINVQANRFSRPGYVFRGWNTEEDGSGVSYAAGETYRLTAGEDILYAQWAKADSDVVETGGTADLSVWMMLLAVSAAALWALIGVRRKPE
ncbi:MAG: InlB B-repeat-containing protein, partial [Firmicutes bacterium]|nr:InlB B-repeat-containing protein [Bacillota bacterium]